MKLHKWLLSVAAAGMLSAPTVSQAALIEFWDYTVETEWTNWLPNPGVDHFYDAVADEDVLQWGTPPAGSTNRSELRITKSLAGTIQTNGAGNAGATLTHNNWEIAAGSTELGSTELAVNLTFAPAGSGLTTPFNQTFYISFDETPNGTPCLYPDGQNLVPCDDLFILRNPEDLMVSFALDGYLYTARLVFDLDAFASEGGTIGFGDIDGDGVSELYFLTRENFSSVLPTTIIITATPIPEPGAIALVGAGLAGLGFAARRRRKA